MDGIVTTKTEIPVEIQEPQPAESSDRPDATASRLLALLEAALEEKQSLERQLSGGGEENVNARLRTLAHELRGPLNAIIGFSEVIRGQVFGDNPRRYVEYASDIRTSGLHMLELIDSALRPTVGEIEPGGADVAEIASVACRLARLKAENGGLALNADLPREPLVVRAKPATLRQILLNLLDNSIKFTPRGGSINLGARAEGERVLVTVADTGIGIPAAELERIFERNYRVRSDPRHLQAAGSGLGLTIARELARQMGGDVIVESALGQGARFTLSLPRSVPD